MFGVSFNVSIITILLLCYALERLKKDQIDRDGTTFWPHEKIYDRRKVAIKNKSCRSTNAICCGKFTHSMLMFSMLYLFSTDPQIYFLFVQSNKNISSNFTSLNPKITIRIIKRYFDDFGLPLPTNVHIFISNIYGYGKILWNQKRLSEQKPSIEYHFLCNILLLANHMNVSWHLLCNMKGSRKSIDETFIHDILAAEAQKSIIFYFHHLADKEWRVKFDFPNSHVSDVFYCGCDIFIKCENFNIV